MEDYKRMPWLAKFVLALLALGVVCAYIANDRYMTVQGEPFVFDKWEQVYIVPSAGVTVTLKKGN
jgi:hypothetical protein